MGGSDRGFYFCHNLPGLVRACCIPWQSAAARESMDFWVADESCQECCDCRSPFTFLNRRHHCRHCGRIFCGNCGSNWVPAPSSGWNVLEKVDKIRVCNHCFKERELILSRRSDAAAVERRHRSMRDTILDWFCPNREEFVATSYLYGVSMANEPKRRRKDDDEDDDMDINVEPLDFQLLWLPPDEANLDDQADQHESLAHIWPSTATACDCDSTN